MVFDHTRRRRTLVYEPSFGTKVPNFGKSSKIFGSEGCIFEKLFEGGVLKNLWKTFVLKVWLKIFEGFEIVS